jgi:hypothetical protein
MPRVEFKPTIPVFERTKTVLALDRAATVIGTYLSGRVIACQLLFEEVKVQYQNSPRENCGQSITEAGLYPSTTVFLSQLSFDRCSILSSMPGG